MTTLPIDPLLPDITRSLRDHPCLVLVADPGAGKSTRVPPAILASGLLQADHPQLLLLQPRRVAARSLAARIADEQHWQLGKQVGYHVRFDRHLEASTRLRVLTEGILTRQLVDDPLLESVGCVILDEFHERSLNTDIALALLREIRRDVRPELKIVVMSATLDAEPVAKYLDDCPIIRAPGRTFPVAIEYRMPSAGRLPDRVAAAIQETIDQQDDDGDLLVFLPGAAEIRRVGTLLEPLAGSRQLAVLPLHGSLTPQEQTLALQPNNHRKIVLATNIAETSLTIDGVTCVIDSGMERRAGYDAACGLDRLELTRISQASADQRAGRAGRTAPGKCIRLWTQRDQQALEPFTPPEIFRVDLAGTLLMLHAWGLSDVRQFGWFQPPPEQMLVSAERLLAMLGALTREVEGSITPLGRKLLEIPAHPRIARLLLAGRDAGILRQAAAAAAILSDRDIVREEESSRYFLAPAAVPRTRGPSDLLWRIDLLEQARQSNFAPHLRDQGVDLSAARQATRIADELLRIVDRNRGKNNRSRDRDEGLDQPSNHSPDQAASPGPESGRHGHKGATSTPPPVRSASHFPAGSPDGDLHQALSIALLSAWPDRVVRRAAGDRQGGKMVGGIGIRQHPSSVVTDAEYYLALDARRDDRGSKQTIVRIASSIEESWLEEQFPDQLRKDKSVEFDLEKQKATAVVRTWYRDLLIDEKNDSAVDPAAASAALAQAVRPIARKLFEADEVASCILLRLALLKKQMPEHPWPELDGDQWLANVLAGAAAGRRSVADLQSAGLGQMILGALDYPLDRILAAEAPEALTVPTGNRIRLQYTADGVILPVRLQEMFGQKATPRIAGGRLPVILHLLGPNYRPVQVTTDLTSFWQNTYPQVRKDLRARYPKHAWPEDPTTAPPQAKGRPMR